MSLTPSFSASRAAAAETDDMGPAIRTLADAAHRLHRQADAFGADSFSLFFVLTRGRARLLPVMDIDFPGMSERTRAFLEAQDEAMLRHLASHTAPFACNGGPMALERGEALPRFATDPALPALGFPVFNEGGQRGLVIFSGLAAWPRNDTLWQAHWCCLQCFALVAQLRPVLAGRRPNLTRREMECLRLTAGGLTSEEIAQRLGLSAHTANQYLASTAQKLDATNRIHAVAKAIRLGLID